MNKKWRSTKEVINEDVAEAASVSHAALSHVTNAKEKAQSEAHSHVQQTTINPRHQFNLHIFSLVGSLSQVIKLQILNLIVQYIDKTVQGFADILTSTRYHLFLSITYRRQTKQPTDTNIMICHLSGGLPLVSPVIWNLDTTKIFGYSFQQHTHSFPYRPQDFFRQHKVELEGLTRGGSIE